MRENYFKDDIQPAAVRAAGLFEEGRGKYSRRKIVFDFSHWQSKADGTTSVDWDALAQYPEFGGAYVKLGEPGPTGMPPDRVTDYWQDSAFDSSIDGLYRNQLWIGAYLYLNCGWPLDRGWTGPGFDALHTQGSKSVEAHANDLLKDPNIYITVRKLKIGAGRQFDAARIASLPDKPIDKLVADVEDVHLNNSSLIGDLWIGKTVRGYLDGMRFLMDHGFVKRRGIWTYSSDWVLRSYGNHYLRTVLEREPTICAGYYWDNQIRHTTFPQLIDTHLASIPNSWTPRLFGIPQMFQVAACFTLPEVRSRTGGPSAVDVNVLNMDDSAFDEINPEWVARRGEAIEIPSDPEPEPEPLPKPEMGTVVAPAGVRVRFGASTSDRVLGVMPPGQVVDVEEVAETGTMTWIRIARGLWMCSKLGGMTLVDLR